MFRHLLLVGLILQIAVVSVVTPAKQQIQLSDSYLPVAMQVIAHLTDQMAFEAKDEATATKPTPKPTLKPATKPTTKPTQPTTKPTTKPMSTTTAYVTTGFWTTKPNGWWMTVTTKRPEQTTPYHKPGLFAPVPPKPSDRLDRFQQRFVLLPMEHHSQYTVIGPHETRTDEPFLAVHHEEVVPLMEPSPEASHLLPPHFDFKVSSRSDGFLIDEEINEENLQYLSDNVREMIKMARDPNDDRLVDVWEETRAGPQTSSSKAKLSTSNLRLLLLYDLLSREAKRQRLSDYSGFSPDVMKNLVESSSGGARAQLKMALAKMVERHDCEHEYANNRAKEMVEELAKDESKLSSEIRYLQPLVYRY